jgi:quercetin dioxygenase-like cupin family protein
MTSESDRRDLPPGVHLASGVDGPVVAVVGDIYRFLATGQQTAGRYALWEATIPPGGGPPLHMHSRESEGFFVLEGELVVHVDERRIVAGPGAFVNLEPGTKHGFKNETTQVARMLILVAPAGLERMFLEAGVRLASADAPVPPPDPEEIIRLMAAAPRYGVTLFPPEPPGGG